MKKLIPLFLALTLVLCACGKENNKDEVEMQSSLPGANLVEDVSDDNKNTSYDNDFEHAKSFIGKEYKDFVDEFGEPNSCDYVPSCLGDGEDGQMEYEGFIVTTYKDGDLEIINDITK